MFDNLRYEGTMQTMLLALDETAQRKGNIPQSKTLQKISGIITAMCFGFTGMMVGMEIGSIVEVEKSFPPVKSTDDLAAQRVRRDMILKQASELRREHYKRWMDEFLEQMPKITRRED